MSNGFEIKCPDLSNILLERDTMPREQFYSQQLIQTGLNELINEVRLALAQDNEEMVSHAYPNLEYCEADVKEILRVLEENHYTVSCTSGRDLSGRKEYRLMVSIPSRG